MSGLERDGERRLRARSTQPRAREVSQTPACSHESHATRRVARPSGNTTGLGCLAPGDGSTGFQSRTRSVEARDATNLKDADTGRRETGSLHKNHR
jgi:hypothetical protein